MAEEKSVLVPVLIGCGLVGLLFLVVCGGGMVFFVPRMMQQAEDMMEQVTQEMAKQQLMNSFPKDWRPPAEDVTDEQLFPEAIGTYSRLDHDVDANLPDYGLADVHGQHATYESALSNIEVYAYAVSKEDHNAVMQSVKQAIGENFVTHTSSSMSQAHYEALYFTVSPPPTTGWLWWSEGWLFLFLAEDEFAPTMFQTEYLEAIQPPAPDEPMPASTPDDAAPADVDENSADDGNAGDLPPADDGDFPPPPPKPANLQADEDAESAP